MKCNVRNLIRFANLLLLVLLFHVSNLFPQKSSLVINNLLGESAEISPWECEVEKSSSPGGFSIKTSAGKAGGAVLLPESKNWDLSKYGYIDIKVKNKGTAQSHLTTRFDNKGATGWGNSALNTLIINPGEETTLKVILFRTKEYLGSLPYLKEMAPMNGFPNGAVSHWHTIDAGKIIKIRVSVRSSRADQNLEIISFKGGGGMFPKKMLEKKESYFPMIDTFGQYKWDEWDNKIHSLQELKASLQKELLDLEENKGPANWSKYGGYKGAPKREATGFFRTEKIDGKWWLVDPEGYLYWAHGTTCVSSDAGNTTISGKEKLFENIPETPDHPLKDFYEPSDRKGKTTFNFSEANLFRKYGENWKEEFNKITVKRFKSWGMNNYGGWSDGFFYSNRKTVPYTIVTHPWPRQIGDKFPDVFDPAFDKAVADTTEHYVGAHKNDPYLMGVFINNELHWGGGNPLKFMNTLQSMNDDSPSKIKWIGHLKKEYKSVKKLNAVAGSEFGGWKDVLKSRKMPMKKIEKVALAFYEKICDRYFSVCRKEFKKIAPNILYLGARMHTWNDITERAAGKYCDVLSLNRYNSDLEHQLPVKGVDKPYIVSEFHFGSLDTGGFWAGLKYGSDKVQKGRRYKHYVNSGLKNPYCVGTQWFQYMSQATTGRGDGENGAIGMIDFTDQPYEDLRDAIRDVGYNMYELRLSGKN